jgi:hypothetical protein
MVVQIICNSKEDFPCVGENFKFADKIYPVLQVVKKFKMHNVYFVNVVIA